MQRRHTFPKSHRLRHREDFAAVYEAKVREARGPLVVYAKPNELGHARLGLSTSRKVGTAPRRNRIRRLLREAFRHLQHDLPAGYDLLIVVRPHEPLTLAEYQKLLSALAVKLHGTWSRRQLPPVGDSIPGGQGSCRAEADAEDPARQESRPPGSPSPGGRGGKGGESAPKS